MKKIILSALMLTGALTFAQDGKLTISGTVDVYGTVNNIDGAGTPGLLVDAPQNATAFGLGMANTVFAYEAEKSGVVADLAFGPRAADAASGSNINQLYAYYNVNDKLTVTAGQFNTFLGYEVISAAANFNYTVSYLFNAGPFTHVGVKADYAVNDDLSLMLAVTNPHGNFTTGYGEDDVQLGAQVGFKGQFLNFAYGSDGFGANDQLYVDYTGGFDLSESIYLGINAAYSDSSDTGSGYQGAALYLQGAVSETLSLGLRPEYFLATSNGGDSAVTALTFTASKQVDNNLKVIAEARLDTADDLGGLENSSNDVTAAFPNDKEATTFTVAAVYSF
ncbi:porin [Flavobacteriaceae bacterium]|nr:porin [Flavobacteriaceae bacterium]